MELFVQRAAMLFQGLEVTLAVIGAMVFPTGIIDADEFESHSPARLVVFAVGFAFLVVIILFGPRLLFEGAAGVFMKSLAAELGAAAAHVDRFGVAALFDDGGDPIKLGDFGGTGNPRIVVGNLSDTFLPWLPFYAASNQQGCSGYFGIFRPISG